MRLPRNTAYCAAWNSGFLTTFSWSSGSRNSRGELAHSDAGVKKYPSTRMRAKELPRYRTYVTCLLSLKGSVASYWLCADDFRSSPTRRQFQNPWGLRICAIFGNSPAKRISIDDSFARRHPPHHLSPARVNHPAGQDPEAASAAPSHHSNAPIKPESQSIPSKIVAHCSRHRWCKW